MCEESARDTLSTLKLIADLLKQHATVGAFDVQDLMLTVPSLRIGFHECTLKALRQARLIAHALPLTNPAIRQVQRCRPNLLEGLERLAPIYNTII